MPSGVIQVMASETQENTIKQTGLVYDSIFLEHSKPGHPERPERIRSAHEGLIQTGLLDQSVLVPARAAAEDELRLNHGEAYIQRVRSVSGQGGGQLDPDTYVNSQTWQAAILAAGGLIDLSLSVCQGDLKNGFALVRPPGHHALTDRAMGFCLFNNVAIAAKVILRQPEMDRVAIVDFDVHHGNGTQAVFEADPRVLYVSTHQMPHFPGTGFWDESGVGDGKGTLLNIPLSYGMGDEAFAQCYESLVLPKLGAFNPQMIFVSAGYDTHWQDPLAGLTLSTNGQAQLSSMLVDAASRLCDGRIVFTLEGGYDLEVISHGVANSVRALLGQENFSDPFGPAPDSSPMDARLLENLIQLHGLG